jgi:NADP-dependent 3-hydroxy acid dehydrogenase YdfG
LAPGDRSGPDAVRRMNSRPRHRHDRGQGPKEESLMAAKVWFITGTSRGFGHEWAIAALERGDKVAATARDTASLRELADKYGDAVVPLALDVTDRQAVFDTVTELR